MDTCLNQDGMEYTADNIDALLAERHHSKKIRNAGGRLKGMHKRALVQDTAFSANLCDMLMAY